MEGDFVSGSSAIDSSNIGFQLLKRCGWKEGTGLGVAQQGRLEPLQLQANKNKRGLGAEKIKQKKMKLPEHLASKERNENQDDLQFRKKPKGSSKRMKKMQEIEKQMQEKEFEQAFFREFWPDNV